MDNFNFWQISSGSTEIHLMDYDDFEPTEYTDHLSDVEHARFLTFGHIRRRREFIATRILRKRILGDQHIQYNEIGAPSIIGVGFISISHSSHLVGLAFNKGYMVGLDLETPRGNILDIVPKFLAPIERNSFDANHKLEMTRVWSAKEALYKLAGRKKIIFKEELILSKTASGDWQGQIINPDHTLSVQLDIFDHNGTVVSINNSAIERIE
ncbi:MAG: 4'-phosphopantetheinyl transferase superfamily protein [Crocinitomicaceae bacterium]|nr:4'-phosphopantetheinyl transferase superfamily protein [Crocinitomicaceae bacterium]